LTKVSIVDGSILVVDVVIGAARFCMLAVCILALMKSGTG
jgi:hypothetical protein